MKYDNEFRKSVDKFYTNTEIITDIISGIIKEQHLHDIVFVEPSAGAGALIDALKHNHVKNIQAYDLYPERNDIVKKDFLKLDIRKLKQQNIITFQNPPFGNNCNLAIKFFNKASLFSKEIWQIVPKTFKKDSVKNKLDEYFHLVYEIDMPKNSFYLGGEPYDVPCCFQIWRKEKQKRQKIKPKNKSKYFEFVDKIDATHAVRRVGGRAGQLLEGLEYNENSTYFLKITDLRVVDILKTSDLYNIVTSTAGVRSLSKTELITLIESKI